MCCDVCVFVIIFSFWAWLILFRTFILCVGFCFVRVCLFFVFSDFVAGGMGEWWVEYFQILQLRGWGFGWWEWWVGCCCSCCFDFVTIIAVLVLVVAISGVYSVVVDTVVMILMSIAWLKVPTFVGLSARPSSYCGASGASCRMFDAQNGPGA